MSFESLGKKRRAGGGEFNGAIGDLVLSNCPVLNKIQIRLKVAWDYFAATWGQKCRECGRARRTR